MNVKMFNVMMLATVVPLGWADAAEITGRRIITTEALKSYVEQFNADDEELYANIPNSDALSFLKENIPLFECPDQDFQRTYYFRWWTYRKHVKSTEDGYVVTEFMPKVGWSGKHNTISCPAAHHFYEGRWLHNTRILDDYATFWLRKGGSPRSYSFWIADAYYNRNLVTPNNDLLVDLLPDLIKNYEAWEEGWEWSGHKIHIGQRENGLFYTIDDRDGGEVSIGGHGFRPTLNSFMYGDAKAIAAIARMAGENDIANTYEQKAATLKELVQTKLWDDEAQFFKILPAPHQKGLPSNNKQLRDIRELYGYTPWYFNLPDPGREAGWDQLMDPKGFYAPYGPTFAEQRHPGFKISYEGHECQWNGPSWPLATCGVLTGLANLLNNYEQDVIGKDAYFETLKIYTQSHQLKRKDGKVVPWIDENLNPYTGDWISRTRLLQWAEDDPVMAKRKGGYERGKDYNHSTYNDLIITGLVGLRPRTDNVIEVNPLLPTDTWDYFCLDNVLYHGRILTIVWDKTGEKYGKGKGLTVLSDGKQVAHAETLSRVTGDLGPKQQEASDYPIQPVTFEKVSITEGMWADRLATNKDKTLPACFQKSEETGRIQNFEVAAGLKEGGFQGIFFNDSDLFKIIEGGAYSLTIQHDPELDATLDGLIAKIAAAQEEDGYLYTARTIGDPKYNYPGKEGRWSHVRDGHELYNVGHMYEAAVAHYQATGKRTFLDVALKNADLVCEVFGPGEGQRVDAPGHQEIEMGLVKLFRVTGEKKYLDLAQFFLDMRGRKDKRTLFGANRQDHLPVKEQREAVGHAVRAAYMYAGMADVAALTGDQAMLNAINTIWDNIVSKKLYLTGGIGGKRHGEAFAGNYELPNREAYNETCAAIANAMFNHRMFLLHGHARYMDVVERIVYNGFLSGVSLEGDTYFYPNPLSSDGRYKFNQGLAERSPWFGCSCCPANIVRFVPSIPGYMYAVKDDSLYVNLFAAGTAEVDVAGQKVKVTQRTRYPWDGRVEFTIEPEHETEFTLRVRVPGWVRGEVAPSELYRYVGQTRTQVSGFRFQVLAQHRDEVSGAGSGEEATADSLDNGYLVIDRKWAKGDTVVLDLSMEVRRVVCDERVEANRGRVAFERGPIVYAAEAADHGGRALNLWVRDEAVLRAEHRPDMLGGVTVLRGDGQMVLRDEDGDVASEEAALTLIPYYAWNHRGVNEMRVWLPRTEEGADPSPAPTIASGSRVSASHHWKADHVEALNDQFLPASSADHDIPRFTWWDHKGGTEWVQYDFKESTKVSAAEVYWFDDTGRGQCRVPASWRLLYRQDGAWKPVNATDAYDVSVDQFNRVRFEPVETDALRIEVELQPGMSGGILEWRVSPKSETRPGPLLALRSSSG